ncbi:MFS transporter [Conexibacter sp. JD483]|uniref:MFS transporter n=1 Tax=unclassified Conexibacter TaxID=2627773 RepID=UPI002715DF14|nr:MULTISPECIES: MFS transporter [unclassified Conexibacter]MDO8189506.1 MFS transporter [Conexibacter sp. CPCC 205706]MDO8202088.1 MFS transporter [Conexibacter sp. CPCC 205762]MDR9372928.1 MFS transporter [Conexibacter sp. JD483]
MSTTAAARSTTPAGPPPAPSLRRRRDALFLLFFLMGLAMASWVARTPDMRDLLGASTGEMGLVLLGLAGGSMAGILLAGVAVARRGPRAISTAGMALLVGGVVVVAVGAAVASRVLVTAGLALFGFGMGGADVALNVAGAEVERELRRPTFPALHGCFSLGTLVGAAIGIGLTAIALAIELHLLAIAVVVAAGAAYAVRSIAGPARGGSGDAAPATDAGDGSGAPATDAGDGAAPATAAGAGADAARRDDAVWRDPRLLAIGAIVLSLALAEGAANDWLPLLMVDGHGLDPALGSAAYTVFAATMTIGRFGGGRFVARYGEAAVLRATALISALGIVLVSLVDSQPVSVAAVVLWGIGASLGFPVALSAAGQSGPNTGARVSTAATIGYVAFLVGPPALGALGQHVGLRDAMLAVVALVVAASFLTPAARPRPAA